MPSGILLITVLCMGCGAGLPSEEFPPKNAVEPVAQGCALTGAPLDFGITNVASTLFWAADGRTTDEAKIKLLFEIPADQLPGDTVSASIRVVPQSVSPGGHVDTAFRIVALDPAGLTGFAGGGQPPLRLRIRYDPVKCEIPAAVESTLVLGRLDSNGQWREVCGEKATLSAGIREVACDQGDLSFGVFGVINPAVTNITDPDAPFFPDRTVSLSLNNPTQFTVEMVWGGASDGSGSGIKGYRVYIDQQPPIFFADTTSYPSIVRYTLRATGTLDLTQTHRYSVSAVDNADNESARFGNVSYP